MPVARDAVKTEIRTALSRVSLLELLELAREVQQEITVERELSKECPVPEISSEDLDVLIAYVEDGGGTAEYHLAALECKRARAARDWPRLLRAWACLDKSCIKALPQLGDSR